MNFRKLLAGAALALDIELPVAVTVRPEAPPAVTVAKVVVPEVTLRLDNLTHASTSAAVVARYEWRDADGKTVRRSETRISGAELYRIIGEKAAQEEAQRLLSLIQAVVVSEANRVSTEK